MSSSGSAQSQMNEDPIARRVSQVRITRTSRTRKQKIAKAENHNVTMKQTQRKNSRTSSHEDKVEMEDITSKYKVVKYVDKKNLEWNTDLIEMMEIKHVMSQAAQDLDDGGTRHESREAEAREHEEVQWTKHGSRSDSEAQQPDLTSRGGVLGECVYARCPHHRSDIQARSFVARTLGENGKECQAEGRQKWSHEKPQLDNAPKLPGIYFIRRPSRMLARNRKHQWLPLCRARSARTIKIVGMGINPIKPNQNLCVFWKPENLPDCVWENHYQITMRDHIAGKRRGQFTATLTIWFTNLLLCLKP